MFIRHAVLLLIPAGLLTLAALAMTATQYQALADDGDGGMHNLAHDGPLYHWSTDELVNHAFDEDWTNSGSPSLSYFVLLFNRGQPASGPPPQGVGGAGPKTCNISQPFHLLHADKGSAANSVLGTVGNSRNGSAGAIGHA